MADTLTQHSVADRAAIDGTISELAEEPACQVAQMYVRRLRKLEGLLEIYRLLRPAVVDFEADLSTEDFYNLYYSSNRPVVLSDVATHWKATTAWGEDYFRTNFGDVLVEVMTGRNTDPLYEINCNSHRHRILFRDYVTMVEAAVESNDTYMVANNAALNIGLGALYADLGTLNILDGRAARGNTFRWYGPRGTVTPLHHDKSNTLMVQIRGRKRITLVSPFETRCVYNTIGVYSDVDIERPDLTRYPLFHEAHPLVVELGVSDALFVPVGWWHHVRALETSITVSFTNFWRNNSYDWVDP